MKLITTDIMNRVQSAFYYRLDIVRVGTIKLIKNIIISYSYYKSKTLNLLSNNLNINTTI